MFFAPFFFIQKHYRQKRRNSLPSGTNFTHSSFLIIPWAATAGLHLLPSVGKLRGNGSLVNEMGGGPPKPGVIYEKNIILALLIHKAPSPITEDNPVIPREILPLPFVPR
jgi:hypothetical protein